MLFLYHGIKRRSMHRRQIASGIIPQIRGIGTTHWPHVIHEQKIIGRNYRHRNIIHHIKNIIMSNQSIRHEIEAEITRITEIKMTAYHNEPDDMDDIINQADKQLVKLHSFIYRVESIENDFARYIGTFNEL